MTDTSSADFRHDCEVRYVAAMRSDAERRTYLTGVFEKRGKAAWQRLRFDVWNAMERVA